MTTGTPTGTQHTGGTAPPGARGLRAWVRARSQQAAERAVDGLYESVRADPDSATGPGAASVTASVLAWAVHLVTASMVVLAAVLLVLTPSHPMAFLGAALLLCAAWLTRPRPGSAPVDVQWVSCPAVLDLVHQIARAAGAPVPHRVGFDDRLNATYHVVGWRRERLLVIGMPLWEALPGQQRVALVAHELGHAAAGDSRHRLVVSSALAALREWMLVCHYETSPVTGAEHHSTQNAAAGIVQLSEMAARWLLAVIGLLPAGAYTVLLAATQRQSQRAEYGADLAGAGVAGRQAMVAALSTVMEGDALVLAMRRTAMGSSDRDVLAAIRAEGQRLQAEDWPSRRNRHRNGPFDSHPPDELRRSLVQTLPERPPGVVLDDLRAARIDAELEPVRAWATRRVYDSFQAH